MLEIQITYSIKPVDNRMMPEIPIARERFTTISKPVDYPIVDPSLTSTSDPKNYK